MTSRSSKSTNTRSSRSKQHSSISPMDLLPGHADQHQRSQRKEREKKSGFDWGDGVALALIGAATVFSIDKALESRRERRQDRASSERGHSVRDEDSVRGGEERRRLKGSRTWAHDEREWDLDRVDEEDQDGHEGEDWGWFYDEKRKGRTLDDSLRGERYERRRTGRKGSW